MERLPVDEHQDLQDLLPWYANGQLDPSEHARVEAHLHGCAACQAELRLQRQLESEIRRLPIEVEQSWARMQRRLEEERRPTPPIRTRGVAAGGFGWAARPGWAIAAALMMTFSVLLLTFSQPARYHALGAAPAAALGPARGNVLVMFRPDMRERDMRAALQSSAARLVDGPTAAGAYVLQVPAPRRAEALAKLRARADIELAEPLDPAAAP
jgi:anti-sigma factor RsiW